MFVRDKGLIENKMQRHFLEAEITMASGMLDQKSRYLPWSPEEGGRAVARGWAYVRTRGFSYILFVFLFFPSLASHWVKCWPLVRNDNAYKKQLSETVGWRRLAHSRLDWLRYCVNPPHNLSFPVFNSVWNCNLNNNKNSKNSTKIFSN